MEDLGLIKEEDLGTRSEMDAVRIPRKGKGKRVETECFGTGHVFRNKTCGRGGG